MARKEPTANNAASRTLPLGTTAKVTNLETGKTAVVTIRDRGPYVAVESSTCPRPPLVEIGLDKRTGITQVKVAPIAVPMPNGEIKLGDGVMQANNRTDRGSSCTDRDAHPTAVRAWDGRRPPRRQQPVMELRHLPAESLGALGRHHEIRAPSSKSASNG